MFRVPTLTLERLADECPKRLAKVREIAKEAFEAIGAAHDELSSILPAKTSELIATVTSQVLSQLDTAVAEEEGGASGREHFEAGVKEVRRGLREVVEALATPVSREDGIEFEDAVVPEAVVECGAAIGSENAVVPGASVGSEGAPESASTSESEERGESHDSGASAERVEVDNGVESTYVGESVGPVEPGIRVEFEDSGEPAGAMEGASCVQSAGSVESADRVESAGGDEPTGAVESASSVESAGGVEPEVVGEPAASSRPSGRQARCGRGLGRRGGREHETGSGTRAAPGCCA
jgi:hypothetical protein